MLTAYLREALSETHVEKMDDDRWFLSLPSFPGVWADGESVEAARIELEEVYSKSGSSLSLRRGDSLPVFGNYNLNVVGYPGVELIGKSLAIAHHGRNDGRKCRSQFLFAN